MSDTRFTQRAQTALRLAQESASELGHGYVGSEHLLLGLAREGQGVAAKVLQAAGLGPEDLKKGVADLVGRGAPGGPPAQGLTPRCKKIIELALSEAVRLDHHYVGTEHLLLGILREGDGVAVRVLSAAGVEARRLRADVTAAMGGEPAPPPCRGGAGQKRPRPGFQARARTGLSPRFVLSILPVFPAQAGAVSKGGRARAEFPVFYCIGRGFIL